MGRYGMGGMGGMGMMGNQGGEGGGFMQTMQMMESMSFVIQSLCQVAQTLEHNAMGLSHLFTGIVGLIKRTKDWTVSGVLWLVKKIKSMIMWAMFKLRIISREEFNSKIEGREDLEELDMDVAPEEMKKLEKIRKKRALYSFIMKCSLALLGAMLL
jgi:hypothetical protein